MENKTEYMKQYNKEYYVKNKEKLLADAVTKVKCECCDIECSKSNMPKHIKTEKHLLHVKLNQLNLLTPHTQ